MKIRIEVDKDIVEDEIVIRCGELTSKIYEIQELLSKNISKRPHLVFYKGDMEHYISLDEILFFETDSNKINGHTIDKSYEVKYKLYELEEMLPREFIRVSKSTIVNVKHIVSIKRNITSASLVEFKDTYKKTYASRHYYEGLRVRLEEVRR